jgi:hypothetical protein
LNKPAKSETPKIASTTVGPEFSFFRTHRQGKAGITATWGLNSETGVQSYSLERTYEDPTDPYSNWETVCILPCSNGRSYKFTDANVFPGYISYKVKAAMADGSEMISFVSTIHIISH